MVTTRSAARRVDPGPGRHQRHRTRKKRRVDDDDNNEAIDKVTCVILSKLPVRSLMRFKCVCKPWRLLVGKDPYFIDLHFTNSKTHPNFFTVIEKPYVGTALLVTGGYLSSDEARGKAVVDIHNTREIDVPNHVRFFRPLDGLIGFYDSRSYNGIRLSNVCTQETTPWIKSTFLKKLKPGSKIVARSVNCQLGFDPASKRHKVICICAIVYQHHDLRRTSDIFCEVLTVGDHEWRRIAEDLECWSMIAEDDDWRRTAEGLYYLRLEGSSVYLNGCIYYTTFRFMRRDYHGNDKIVVFDVGSEKFRAITIPNFILYHPRNIDIDDYFIVLPISLSEMDGQLALLCRINGNIVKLWLYDDDFKKNNTWREITIELPFVWDEYTRLSFHPVVGKNQIIIKSCACQNYAAEPGKICSLSYHSYDWMKKTFTEIKINGIPSAIGRLFKTCHSDAIFTESLFPVQ